MCASTLADVSTTKTLPAAAKAASSSMHLLKLGNIAPLFHGQCHPSCNEGCSQQQRQMTQADNAQLPCACRMIFICTPVAPVCRIARPSSQRCFAPAMTWTLTWAAALFCVRLAAWTPASVRPAAAGGCAGCAWQHDGRGGGGRTAVMSAARSRRTRGGATSWQA
jgi:hypothetical protein